MKMKHQALNQFLREMESQYSLSISVCNAPIDHDLDAFRWRSGEVRPAASLIKLFLLGAIAQGIASKEFREDDILFIDRGVGGSGLIKYMKFPTNLSLGELIYMMLVYSDNTAANALLSLASLEAVNNFAAAAGAHTTKMTVPMMPSSDQLQAGPNVTTADDITRFYRGVASGFPEPIHPDSADTCRRFLKPTRRSLFDTTRFLLSGLNRRGLLRVIKQNALRLPLYLRAATSTALGKRIRVNVPTRSIMGRKPATGRAVYHDSCLYLTPAGPSSLVVMIESDSADFSHTETPEYKAARGVCSEIGRLLSRTEFTN